MLKNTQKTAEDRNTLIKTTAMMLIQYKHTLLLLKNCWKERKKESAPGLFEFAGCTFLEASASSL